jgi:hypothetical protein
MSFPLHAQEGWDDEFQMLRPECSVMETSLLGEVRLAPRRVGSQATAPLKAKGVQKVPVVLVAFADQGFSVADTNEGVIEYYQKFCNGTKDGHIYTGHGSHGSIRDFFVEQSDSVFLPEFVVIGPVVQQQIWINGHYETQYLPNGTTTVDWIPGHYQLVP